MPWAVLPIGKTMTTEQFKTLLDSVLKRFNKVPEVAATVVARVLARLAPQTLQKLSYRRLPGPPLYWQFALARPRSVTVACYAALGFVIGIAGLDYHSDHLGKQFAVASRDDLVSGILEPKLHIGIRP